MTMQDSKNGLLAIFSGIPAYIAAVDAQTITIISAIVLPVFFFCVGKAVDVAVQIYLRRRRADKDHDDQ